LLNSILSPVREKVEAEFGGTLQEALSGSISRITGSVSQAIGAAIQAAAATGLATINEAIDTNRAKIVAAIHGVLNPQFDRIGLELDKLIASAVSKLDPLFEQLHALTDIEIGDNFSTIENVEVEVTALGIRNAYAFVGLPPSAGFNFDLPLVGQLGGAIGLYVDNLNMALGIFKPVMGKLLPTFTALKLSADEAGFSDGDPSANVLELIAKGIKVELNLGGPIVPGAGALFGNATIDFAASFPAAGLTPAGYAVQTSTTGNPIYLDFANGELIRASVAHASLKISDFVFISGSIAFEKGNIDTVQVTGGLTGPLVDTVLDGLGLDPSTIPLVGGIPWAGGDHA